MKIAKMIALFLCLILLLGMMTACQKKMPLTAAGFTEIMENAGLEVRDDSDAIDEDSLPTAVMYAAGKDYLIEYYAFADSQTAQRCFDSNQKDFDEENPRKTMTVQITSGRYDYYAFTTSDQFYVLTRIENTMVGCITDAQYKQAVLEHIEALGYK